MVLKFTNQSLRYVLDEYFKETEATNFEKNTDDFLNFLDSLPKEADITALSLKDYEMLLIDDSKKAAEEFNKEINSKIRAIWIISSFKIYKLLNGIIQLLEKGDLYSAIILIRALIETTCFCNHRLSEINLMVKEANRNTHNFMEYAQFTAVLEDLLLVSRRGTKIPIFLNKGTDTILSERISESISYVSKQEKYNKIKRNYSLLCDFVHPNMLSNEVFGIPTKLYQERKDKKFIQDGIIMIPGEVDKYIRDLSDDESIINNIRFLGLPIKSILLCFDLFKETLEKYQNINLELCYKPVSDILSEEDKARLKKLVSKD